MFQSELTARFRPKKVVSDDKEGNNKVREVPKSSVIKVTPRRRRRRAFAQNRGVAWECTRVTAEQEMRYDAISNGRSPVEDNDATDQAMKSVDILSRYAKDRTCTPNHRRQTFALKNMIMLLLWKRRSEMYVGIWKHISKGIDLTCWECKGTGEKPDSLEPCPKCAGTCIHKRTDLGSMFTVFAVQGSGYSTTWHLPSNTVDTLLGVVPYGHDLVTAHTWPAYDLRKTPAPLNPEEYEYHRSYLAWFVTRSSMTQAS